MYSIYIFIIAQPGSKDNGCFYRMNQKRRQLMRKYNIPYTIIHWKKKEIPTTMPMFRVISKEEIEYTGNGHSTKCFLEAVNMYLGSFDYYDDTPDFILRVEGDVYIHMPKFMNLLSTLSQKGVVAGHGPITLFSKDMIQQLGMYQNILEYDSSFTLPKQYIKNLIDLKYHIGEQVSDDKCIYYNNDMEKMWDLLFIHYNEYNETTNKMFSIIILLFIIYVIWCIIHWILRSKEMKVI